MDKKQKKTKKMMTVDRIYKIMQRLPVIVASLFFLINAIKGNGPAMLVIGLCLAVFIGLSVFSQKRNLDLYKREFILAMALPTLVFLISLFSGASYSDDFPLFLAVIAMTGMFLEPQFTRVQLILVDIYLVIMYLVHPEKSGGLSQYILCAACFTLAAFLYYQVILRGRAFIEISEERAKESEVLLDSMRAIGAELQNDFEASSGKIEDGTKNLQKGSALIAHGAGQVSDSCNVVQGKIKETGEQITLLNEEVKQFEAGLTENKNNVSVMNQQISSVGELITESAEIFHAMEGQMNEIVGIAKKINDISFKLTILSLNAAVESAQAGTYGAGFEVIASEMRELSETSGGFADQVAEVVKGLRQRVEMTSVKFAGSEEALAESKQTMAELVESFDKLSSQFTSLYSNMEYQNQNINQIDYIFDDLNHRVTDMHNSSLENQDAVAAIASAMDDYREHIDKVVKNTQSI